MSSGTPIAGPEAREARHGDGAASGGSDSRADPLLDSLQANQGDSKYSVAVTKGKDASPIILNTNEPVISLGGFGGYDPVFSNERLAGLISDGAVRYFLVQQKGELKNNNSVRWIQDNCEQVPPELYGKKSSFKKAGGSKGKTAKGKTVLLYDCGTKLGSLHGTPHAYTSPTHHTIALTV